ncbi:MAG TPA: alpha/beta fold hydrolase [Acidimicrobiia bacterium]|nr:alpha/beta fold hydrolase [Acidimicrobiia bacterium]
MSAARRTLKTLGVAAGVAATAAGTAYVAQRAALAAIRRRPDPDAGNLGQLEFDDVRRFPSHDGGTVYTAIRGHGPPILFSHGVTITSRVWIKQFRSLPPHGVQTIAFDHRGHGESTLGDTGHSIDNLAADLRTVLETLDLRDAILVGHSMGGVAVQAFALRHPDVLHERVRGLVLDSTLAKTSLSASRQLRGLAERVTGVFDLRKVMDHPNLGSMFARVGFGREPLASHLELNREMLASCDSTTAREATTALLSLDLTAELPRLDIPTLVLGGTADVITPPAESRRLAELIPGAQLHLFEGAGHMLMLERSDAFDDLLLDFARDLGVLPAAAGAA